MSVICLVGNFAGTFHLRSRNLDMSKRCDNGDNRDNVENMGSRYLDMKKLGSEIHSLKNYKAAMEKLKRGEISKVVFDIKNSELE